MKKESTSSLPDKFIDGLPVQVYTSPVPFAFLEFKHFAVNNMLSVSIFWSSKKRGQVTYLKSHIATKMVKTLNDKNTNRGKQALKITWPKGPRESFKERKLLTSPWLSQHYQCSHSQNKTTIYKTCKN